MHNNYYFLRQLSAALEAGLGGAVVSECFSQNREELIVRFETATGLFIIRAALSGSFSCLSFPSQFQRARRNSIDLFPELIGHRVHNVRQFDNERSFAILFDEGLAMLFKMHGNRSNVILFENERQIALFKSNAVADASVGLGGLDRAIDWSFEHFLRRQLEPAKLYFTFGKVVWQYLLQKGYDALAPKDRHQLILEVRLLLETGSPLLIRLDGSPHLSLLGVGEILKRYEDPLTASTDFFHFVTQTSAYEREKNQLLAQLKKEAESARNYLKKTSEKMKELQGNDRYKTWADLIMANMHKLSTGPDKVILPDFSDGSAVEIRMKKDLSPQKNAALYYRKAKNQQIEIAHLQKAIDEKTSALSAAEKKITELESATDLRAVRKFQDHSPSEDQKSQVSLPFHEFEFKGWRIWVGKNAQSNDILTLKHTYKEDLWLHAKDVAGSHVVVKYQAGKNFPKEVIERAAQLAAYNSKRKNESLCPVIVTPKKFVRKRKGDPAGAVVVDREEVIMVEPRL